MNLPGLLKKLIIGRSGIIAAFSLLLILNCENNPCESGCGGSRTDCPGPFPIPAPPMASPYCAENASEATDIGYLKVDWARPGKTCYYKYSYAGDGTQPTVELYPKSGSGNVDLYVGLLNDSTAGDPGYVDCNATTEGGGWIRCSRSLSDTPEILNLNQAGIPTMASGDFRVIAVTNKHTEDVNFSLHISGTGTVLGTP